MKKIKIFAIATLLIVVTGFNIVAFSANKLDDNTLKLLDLFGDVFDKIKNDYVEKKDDKELVEAAINGMLSSLDPHSTYLDEKSYAEIKVEIKGEFGGIGTEVTMENGLVKIVSPIDDTPAFKAGIKTGDYVIAINDEPVMNMYLGEAVKKMRGQPGTKLVLTILREGKAEPMEISLVREVIKTQSVKSRIENNIAYLRITSFSETTAGDLLKEFTKLRATKGFNMEGMVLDLRNNPGGLLDQAIKVSDAFIDRGEIVLTKERDGKNVMKYSATAGDIMNGMPIVVLINGGSASAAEIVAGALQDHKRAVLMGTKSFGKGSVQSVIPIQNYGAIKLTTARYYTPSGRSIQAEGIVPDIIVEEAKVELPSDTAKKMVSEMTLKGHLKNEKKDDIVEKDDASKKKGKSVAKLDPIYAKDFQLARAIDLIKAMVVLKDYK